MRNIDTSPSTETIFCDYLVVGAGVAGLRAAIELAQAGAVLVVAKDRLSESSSEYAQGGIAVALSDDDEVDLHEQDTINAGAGLCDREAVRILVEEGPAAIQQLIDWGAEFDREGAKLLFAREGAHSRNRVLHARGDSTGQEIARTLYQRAASLDRVEFRSFSAITDLLVEGDTVTGAVACDAGRRHSVRIEAKAVLLATGGLGRVFLETTNPDVATGDGVAVAYRAGAVVSDIEFVQFHPTALYVEGAPRFLLTEALRGEGAYLRNGRGERFMVRYHELAELAPRDVVARSIVTEMRQSGASVYLDLTHLEPDFIRKRFPRVHTTCMQHGVDITAGLVPVHPAAHYAMGGVRTDEHGRTSLRGLFAAGEAACSGVHGANRLASNSLLEGVVFGARAGVAMREECKSRPAGKGELPEPQDAPALSELDVRRLTWQYCGLLRDAAGLKRALNMLLAAPPVRESKLDRNRHDLRSIHLLAQLIARCAMAREESRGAHYRTDFPETRTDYQRHSLVRKEYDVTFS
jgi:L-aspartate oxidase